MEKNAYACVCVRACVQTQRDESIFGTSLVGGRERGCCELYEWNKMKYKRKLYLSKTESEKERREKTHATTFTCVHILYNTRFIVRASLAIIYAHKYNIVRSC